MSQIPQPPPTFTSSERRAFRALARRLRGAGIDAAARSELIADSVLIEPRVAQLVASEAKARPGRAKDRASRALNAALAEKRRLHQAVWQGARRQAAEPEPAPAEARETSAKAQADAAWRALLWGGRGHESPESYQAAIEAAEAQFGEPSWAALLYHSPEDEAEGEAIIAASRRRSG